jgi:hypothetical protein
MDTHNGAFLCVVPGRYDSFRTEAWRLPGTTRYHGGSEGGPFHCDHVSDPAPPPLGWDYEDDIYTDDPPIFGRWVRFAGEGGDALYTEPLRGPWQCGTQFGMWLSGWDPEDGIPPPDYDTPATLPTPADGLKPMTVRPASRLFCFLRH